MILKPQRIILILVAALICTMTSADPIKLSIWDRGVKLTSPADKDLFTYLWFYEWNMFEAVRKGEHTSGTSDWKWGMVSTQSYAQTSGDWFDLSVTAAEDGAELLLKVTNTTDRDWPDIASIIPCFNPGYDGPKKTNAIPNPNFYDDGHDHTYFCGEDGLDLLAGEAPREIHFNDTLQSAIESSPKQRDDGQFVWYHKWPRSPRNAHKGLLVRESEDRTQTMAIVWEDFLTAQGHNPWKCMHLSIRVGPLKPGESKSVRGKMYLFEGTKKDLLKKLKKDFPNLY